MIKPGCLLLGVIVVSGTIGAQEKDSCAGLSGFELTQCRSDQQTLRQQRLEQQIQEQQERQNQLDRQQRDVQQQLEAMRLQNEMLRKDLEREKANQGARPVATDYSKSPEVKSWRAENPWFGSDYSRTAFATNYLKQLQKEQPDLTGRPLLDALSAKVDETFGPKH